MWCVHTSVHKYEIAAYLTKFYDKLKKFLAGTSFLEDTVMLLELWTIVMLNCGGRMEDIESK